MTVKGKLIQSTLKLTKAQWNRLLIRMVTREAKAGAKAGGAGKGMPDLTMPEQPGVGLGQAMQRGVGAPMMPGRARPMRPSGPGPLTVSGKGDPMEALLDIKDKGAQQTFTHGMDIPGFPGGVGQEGAGGYWSLLDARLNATIKPHGKVTGPKKAKVGFEPVIGERSELSGVWKESAQKAKASKEHGRGITPSTRLKFNYKAYMTGSQKDTAQRSKSFRRRKGPALTVKRLKSGQATPGELMSFEPPQEEVYSRLYAPGQEGVGKKVLEKPYEEAIELYKKGKGRLTAETGTIPSAKIYSQGRFVKRRYRSVEPKAEASEVRKAREAKKIAIAAREQDKIQKLGEARKLGQKVKELPGVVGRTISELPVETAIKQAALAEHFWKFVGGGRSAAGRLWDRWRMTAKGRYKVKSAKDFFETAFIRWVNNPESYTKSNQREGEWLAKVWEQYKVAVKGGG